METPAKPVPTSDERWFRFCWRKDANPARIRGLAPVGQESAQLFGLDYLPVLEEIDPPDDFSDLTLEDLGVKVTP